MAVMSLEDDCLPGIMTPKKPYNYSLSMEYLYHPAPPPEAQEPL